jgi:hypothetical protein
MKNSRRSVIGVHPRASAARPFSEIIGGALAILRRKQRWHAPIRTICVANFLKRISEETAA